MKTYIAGKITGLDNYQELFHQAKCELLEIGHTPASPVDLAHDHDKSWESYMKECIGLLATCEAVYMLTNWNDSKGAMVEHWLALWFKMKIIYQ